MTLKLYHIDNPNCNYITELMPSIFAVAQMEQEFYPYLTIDYIPHVDGQPQGIILRTKSGDIRRNYTFKNKQDIKDLRNLIWYHLEKQHKFKPAKNENDFTEAPKNIVIQGWKAKRRMLEKEKCCKLVLDNLTSQIVNTNILHEVYRLSPIDKQDRNTCKKVRFESCVNNFPKRTAAFDRCIQETVWLCNRGYPNNTVNKMNKYVEQVRRNLYNYLDSHDLKVNKRKFDEIIDAGLFDDLGNRMGNKVADDKNVRATLDKIFTEKDYYLGLIEGFDHTPNFDIPSNNNKWHGISAIVLLILIISFIYLSLY